MFPKIFILSVFSLSGECFRQMKILGPGRTQLDTDARALVAAGAAFSNMPLKFTSSKMASYISFR